jgi:nucleoside-diphosphate-sugar epimerase
VDEPERVLILGCGYAGAAIARLARARGLAVVANVRSDARAASLRREGFEVLQRGGLDETVATHVSVRTHVVIAFPPDGATDARVVLGLGHAARVTYLSSTGVYGEHRGVVDDTTPVPALGASDRGARILAAEEAYRSVGATVLRCPALYGRDRGLHARVLRGEHRIPGDGTRFLSRIHVDDLAQLVLASGLPRGSTMVVGDLEPAPHGDVVRFISEAYGIPMPPFVPLESVHESLRADRRVDGSRALAAAGVTLRYPSYRDGMSPAATGLAAKASPHLQ